MITFRFSGRTPTPGTYRIGMETDQGAETLRFLLPQISDQQSAQLMLLLPDGTPEALLIRDGMAAVPASLCEQPGRIRGWVEILGSDTVAWNSEMLYLDVGDLPPISEQVEHKYPTAIQDAMDAADSVLNMKEEAADYRDSAELAFQLTLAAGALMNARVEGHRLVIRRALAGETDAYLIAAANGFSGTREEWNQYVETLGRNDRLTAAMEAVAEAADLAETAQASADAASGQALSAASQAAAAANQAALALNNAAAAQTAADAAAGQATENASALAGKIKEAALVIPADAWEEQEGGEFTAAVSAPALAGADTVIAGMSGSVTKEEYEMFCAAGVVCTGWAEGVLTFTAYGEAPTMSLQISVMGVTL